MTPAELDTRVGRLINALFVYCHPREVPPSWARHCHALLLRTTLRQLKPEEAEQAAVIRAAAARLGLVEVAG